MASCEMCGRQDRLFRTSVEGAELMLCKDCSRFGKVLAAPMVIMKKETIAVKKVERPEIVQSIVIGYGKLVKDAREKAGLKQEELAMKLQERESIIQKVESGKFEPSIALARKLEKFLSIKLVEEGEAETSVGAGRKTGPVTIGDVIQIRTRKK